jgi:hypothetical protein
MPPSSMRAWMKDYSRIFSPSRSILESLRKEKRRVSAMAKRIELPDTFSPQLQELVQLTEKIVCQRDLEHTGIDE